MAKTTYPDLETERSGPKTDNGEVQPSRPALPGKKVHYVNIISEIGKLEYAGKLPEELVETISNQRRILLELTNQVERLAEQINQLYRSTDTGLSRDEFQEITPLKLLSDEELEGAKEYWDDNFDGFSYLESELKEDE